jgi:hypothetical protein
MEIPNEYLCPIALEIMVDPVICEDGYTYDRKTIESLPNSLSPMTRQSIDRSKLIPNRNLKNLIDSFIKLNGLSVDKLPSNNAVSKKSGSDDLMGVMMSERMGALERFEYEQRQKEIARREQINKEKMEKERKLKEERAEKERKLKEEQELNKMVERVCAFFNSKDVPSFNAGWRYFKIYQGGQCCQPNGHEIGWIRANNSPTQRYTFTFDMLKKIKELGIDRLYAIYKKLLEDHIWILKYAPNDNHEFKDQGFIDFCFDYYIDKIDELIEKQKKELEQQRDHNSIKINKNALENLLKVKDEFKNPREYYYVNEDHLHYRYKTHSSHSYPEIFYFGEIYNDFSQPHFKMMDHFEYYMSLLGNKFNEYLIPFISNFDKEKKNICSQEPPPHDYFNNYNYVDYNGGGSCRSESYGVDIIYSHKSFVKYNIGEKSFLSFQRKSKCIRTFTSEDFAPLIKLGKLFIELIEFLRPEIVIKHNELNK